MAPKKRRSSRSKSPSQSPSRAPAKRPGDITSPFHATLYTDQVMALRNYKYNCDNKSIICNTWLAPAIWEGIAACTPMFLTPNAVSDCWCHQQTLAARAARATLRAARTAPQVTWLGAMFSYSVFLISHGLQPDYLATENMTMSDTWSEDAPWTNTYSLLCLSAMMCLITYNTLDNVDGKLARCAPGAVFHHEFGSLSMKRAAALEQPVQSATHTRARACVARC
jgi:hypothetical protein